MFQGQDQYSREYHEQKKIIIEQIRNIFILLTIASHRNKSLVATTIWQFCQLSVLSFDPQLNGIHFIFKKNTEVAQDIRNKDIKKYFAFSLLLLQRI